MGDSFCRRGVELIGILTLASLAVFVQTFWLLLHGGCPRVGFGTCNEILWIFVCSGVSLLVCVLLHGSSAGSAVRTNFCYVALFFIVWWALGFFVATFDSPYVLTGNGFFGCWGALIAAIGLFDGTWGSSTSTVRQGPSELLWLLVGSAVVLVAATYER